MKNIYDLNLNEIEEFIINNNGKKYQALQVFEWLYAHKISEFKQMTNVSKELIDLFNKNFVINDMKIIKEQIDNLTNKYLFELVDGSLIEAVLMRHDYGNSICISSQVGCNMGCSFCASGELKKVRDLLVSEMIQPIIMIERQGIKISSVVVMGIGEPFDNYTNLIKFLMTINHSKGLAIGARHITVSTCGIIPKIEAFSEMPLQINLAISLHAPNNELRSKIMKINNVYPIDKIMVAVKNYIVKTNRRVTIEYVMIDNINDSDDNARELANLLRGINVYVNLIPYNETSNPLFKKSKRIMKFYDILKQNKINVTVRKEFGKKIDAACGQLRAKEVNK